MSIDTHLGDGEAVASRFDGDEWTWYVTELRLIRHEESERREKLQDITLEQIVGIDYEMEKSMMERGTESDSGIAERVVATVMIALGILLTQLGVEGITVLGFAFIGFGILILIMIYGLPKSPTDLTGSKASIVLRGNKILSEEEWIIHDDSADDGEQLKEFGRTLHEQRSGSP